MRFVRALALQKRLRRTSSYDGEEQAKNKLLRWRRTSKEEAKNKLLRWRRTSKERAPENGKNEQRTVEELGLWVQSWWTS